MIELPEPLFLKALNKQAVSRPPVWMMRQAGRYLPEYRAVRSKITFETLCTTPDLAAEVTLQPVDLLGVDAAVIFSDILVILGAIGVPFYFDLEGGPRISQPIRSASDIDKLVPAEPPSKLAYVGEAIRKVDAILRPRSVPVIGFAGAPFTLAAYAIEGKTSREFAITRRFLIEQPEAFSKLLSHLAEAIIAHLHFQIKSGARAVQLFDTWGGIMSSPEYRQIVYPHTKHVITEIQKAGVPIILYMNGSTPHLNNMLETGADGLSVDWRMPLDQVRQIVGSAPVLQGNLDPTLLYSKPEVIERKTRKMITDHGVSKLIANLGHGILPDVPVEHARAFIDAVKNYS
ncbi:MAG: uroporphyrinogen decarboxylase [Verrucomicrobiota bacterium]|nr:uroporphyrinogen decarboxylase [Verrucomicrobiota bacterium]